MLLFARYIPLPTAQRLMDAGVDFVDLAGNVHPNLPPTTIGQLSEISMKPY